MPAQSAGVLARGVTCAVTDARALPNLAQHVQLVIVSAEVRSAQDVPAAAVVHHDDAMVLLPRSITSSRSKPRIGFTRDARSKERSEPAWRSTLSKALKHGVGELLTRPGRSHMPSLEVLYELKRRTE